MSRAKKRGKKVEKVEELEEDEEDEEEDEKEEEEGRKGSGGKRRINNPTMLMGASRDTLWGLIPTWLFCNPVPTSQPLSYRSSSITSPPLVQA